MLIFCKEDIFSNKDHNWDEDEEDQSEFEAIWSIFEKTNVPVRKEDAVWSQLSAPTMQQEFKVGVAMHEERVTFKAVYKWLIAQAKEDGCV